MKMGFENKHAWHIVPDNFLMKHKLPINAITRTIADVLLEMGC